MRHRHRHPLIHYRPTLSDGSLSDGALCGVVGPRNAVSAEFGPGLEAALYDNVGACPGCADALAADPGVLVRDGRRLAEARERAAHVAAVAL